MGNQVDTNEIMKQLTEKEFGSSKLIMLSLQATQVGLNAQIKELKKEIITLTEKLKVSTKSKEST